MLLLGYFFHIVLQCFLFFCLLFGKALGSQPLFLCFRLRRIAPGNVSVKILQQMLPGGFELISNESQPQQLCTEGVFFIRTLCFCPGCAFLHKSLTADGKTKLNV